ncbi:MAG: hypothetical protein IPO39_01605 [Bacteroidetes bacterium]|nr:hypothetical protein [Bacteroidota bacterium]
MWSLAVEEQFYLLLPILIFYTPRKYLKGLISVMILTGVISRLLACAKRHNEVYTKVITTSCLDSLGLGAILAYFSLYQKETLLKWIGNKWFVGFCLSLFSINLTIVLTGDPDEDFPLLCSIPLNFFYSLCSCLLIGIACFGSLGGMTEKIFNHLLIIYLRKISYSLYFFNNFSPAFSKGILAILNLPVTIFSKSIPEFHCESRTHNRSFDDHVAFS